MGDDRPPVDDLLQQIGADGLGEDPGSEAVEAVLRRWVMTLDGADDLRVRVERDALADLPGLKAGQIEAALRTRTPQEERAEDGGGPLVLEDPDPWPDPVDGRQILGELTDLIERHLVLPDGAATAIALWVLHAHAHDACAVSPVLSISSPEKRCGKTTLLELLSALVPRPLPASNVTAATIFRAVEKFRPTLLVDEADTFIRDGSQLRGVLNSGHRRSLAYVVRTVGDEHEPKKFRTWAPKAIALIGDLPDTLADRSVEVRMRRKAPEEEVERLRLDRLESLAGSLRRRTWTWARENEEEVRRAEPDMPDGLHDRERDNWRPLLSIADVVGAPWPRRARKAARASTENGRNDRSLGVRLLGDIRSIFRKRDADKIRSKLLVKSLCALEEAPWAEYKGRGLSTVSLANFLRRFDISSKNIRTAGSVYKGYTRDTFEEAFRRYLPREGATPLQDGGDGDDGGKRGRYDGHDVAGRDTPEDRGGSGNVAEVAPREGKAEKEGAEGGEAEPEEQTGRRDAQEELRI